MDGKTPLRVLAARLPLGDICNEIEAAVCAPYLSSGASVHFVRSRHGVGERRRIRQCICRNGGTQVRTQPKLAHRAAVYKALLTSEQNTQSWVDSSTMICAVANVQLAAGSEGRGATK